MTEWFDHILTGVYLGTLALVAVYGLHRYVLVGLYYRNRSSLPRLLRPLDPLPRVTIQLPMYNEQYVARRIIEAACRIDYPRDRMQIQVLDDSTDGTVHIARETVEHMRAKGFDIQYIHRTDRTGFKAGALANGLTSATGDFVAVFDADFLPEPDVLHRSVHYFSDPLVGVVQTRWEHINRDHSLLTRSQAMLLDGHFVIEHVARNRSGRFMSFNGTAGIWRRRCIEDAGGWHHDTLTEDLDLSYRAQLQGWRFVFLPELASPAELPPDMNAFKAQQHRWTKGTAQVARKMLWPTLTSSAPLKVKIESVMHLTSWVIHFCMFTVSILLYPALAFGVTKIDSVGSSGEYAIDMSLFVMATLSAVTFYTCAQRELTTGWRDRVKYLPFLMSLGIGISLSNLVAALQGLFGQCGEFVRTPKYGFDSQSLTRHSKPEQVSGGGIRKKRRMLPWCELAIGVYLCACMVACATQPDLVAAVPFVALFAVGFLYVGLSSLIPSLSHLGAFLDSTTSDTTIAAPQSVMVHRQTPDASVNISPADNHTSVSPQTTGVER